MLIYIRLVVVYSCFRLLIFNGTIKKFLIARFVAVDLKCRFHM